MASHGRVIGITTGDANGIGPEVVRKALESGRLNGSFEYRIIGDTSPATPRASAQAAFAALEEAARLAQAGQICGVVTGPVSKARMHEVGFDFPGQTEFFAARWGVRDYAMCLTGGALTVALVTAHIPLKDVPDSLQTSEIIRTGRLLEAFSKLRLGRRVHLAVAGLNPHAGESGDLGKEEIEIIEPAVARLKESTSAEWSGPHSPDTLFHRAAGGDFDGVLCMYHDQGLIPLKLHAFDSGVNVTLGLPYPRTSPDHGTAFDIAGRGIARPDSMIAAINLAAELVLKSA